ncbi:MAG: hypothetical protein ACRDHV_09545 [Actinomycetota bacterium]
MLRWIRRHGETVVVAGVTALVVSGTPALGHVTKKLGHLIKHLNPVFVNVGEKASDSDLLDGRDSTEFLGVGGKAADADRLDGSDSSAFMRAGEKAADSDLLDGLNSTAFQRSYTATIVVDTVAELLATEMATSGTLVKLEPGVYDLGTQVYSLPLGVDLEGSGMDNTTIVRNGFSSDGPGNATVTSADSEIRSVSIRNEGGASHAIALKTVTHPRLINVGLTAFGGSSLNLGLDVLSNPGFAPARLSGLDILVGGGSGIPTIGIRAADKLDVRDSVVLADAAVGTEGVGVMVSAETVRIEGSAVMGGGDAVVRTGGSVSIASTRLEGGVTGTATCAGVWDGAFTFFASACPT